MARDYARIIITCPECGGRGQVDKRLCPECGGSKQVGRIGTLEEISEFVEKWLKYRKEKGEA